MQLKLLLSLLGLFPKFLGIPEPQTAIILLQNHHEIRATGGFIGSYAKVELKNKIPSFSFQDIYVPDGQLQGHVTPPVPIQQAFGQGWYKLRDANWDPDFPTSSKTIRWFLEKGNEINPDILIAMNLSTIEKILTITGPIQIEPVNLTLKSDNISLLLQNNIQQNFFPGSTNKKDLITSAGQSLIKNLSNLTLKQKYQTAHLLLQEIKTGEILINSRDPKLQAYLKKKDWAGQLQQSISCNNCLANTISIVESNLGSNKANAFVTRQTNHQTTRDNQFVTHKITVNFSNSSPTKDPDPPNHHGGDYLNYLRFYIPANATNIISPPNSTQQVKHGFKEIGFFNTTLHQSVSSATISYELPITNQKSYQLLILKQPGIGNSPQSINSFGETTEINLTQDFTSKILRL